MAENSELVCRLVAAYYRRKLDLSVEYISGNPLAGARKPFRSAARSKFSGSAACPTSTKSIRCAPTWSCLPCRCRRASAIKISRSIFPMWSSGGTRDSNRSLSCAPRLGRLTSRARIPATTSCVRTLPRSALRHGFFGEIVESGAHSASVEMILTGRVDGAAIDSTVLEWLLSQRPELARANSRHRDHRPQSDPAVGYF